MSEVPLYAAEQRHEYLSHALREATNEEPR